MEFDSKMYDILSKNGGSMDSIDTPVHNSESQPVGINNPNHKYYSEFLNVNDYCPSYPTLESMLEPIPSPNYMSQKFELPSLQLAPNHQVVNIPQPEYYCGSNNMGVSSFSMDNQNEFEDDYQTILDEFLNPEPTESPRLSQYVQDMCLPTPSHTYQESFGAPDTLISPQSPHSLMSPMVPMSERSENIYQTMGPETPMTPREANITPQLQNIVSTANLHCKLDLKHIVQRARNSEYNPRRFGAVIMRIREPRTTALIFSSGKIVCTGAKSEDASRLASRKFARIIQKLGFEATFSDFKVQNIVGSCDVRFQIRLEGLVLAHGQFSSYEPELFPGLIYRMVKPRVVILIFLSGKVVLTGAKVRQDIYDAFDNIYPILKNFKK